MGHSHDSMNKEQGSKVRHMLLHTHSGTQGAPVNIIFLKTMRFNPIASKWFPALTNLCCHVMPVQTEFMSQVNQEKSIKDRVWMVSFMSIHM